MEQPKEYYAFISYQRKDEEWAERLRNKLEHYRLPSSVRKQDTSLPKEIRPIFRDALELAGGVLAKEIETALQNSKYLIVICSPNSAKSPWVNNEIQTFINLGREEKIVPFIIDGTPFSDNEETECFPPALRSLKGEKELLGININEVSRDAAAIKVVARMFGLKFDTLWQRYEREKKKNQWVIIGGTLLLAFVSWGFVGYFVKQKRIIEEQRGNLLISNIKNLTYIANINREKKQIYDCRNNLLQIDSLVNAYRLPLASLPIEYEKSLRAYCRIADVPGFSLLTSKILKENFSGWGWIEGDKYCDYTFRDNKMPLLHTWDFVRNVESFVETENGIILSPSYIKWLEVTGGYWDGKILNISNGHLYVSNIYNNQQIGTLIPFKGDCTECKFRKLNQDILLKRGNNLYLANYWDGTIKKIVELKTSIESFDIDPYNKDNVVMAGDSTISVFSISKNKLVSSRKFNSPISDVRYANNKYNILACGNNIMLLYSNLNVLDSIEHDKITQDIFFESFSPSISKDGKRVVVGGRDQRKYVWQYVPHKYDYYLISGDGKYSVVKKNKMFYMANNEKDLQTDYWSVSSDTASPIMFSSDNEHLLYRSYSKKSSFWEYNILDIKSMKSSCVAKTENDFYKHNIILSDDASRLYIVDYSNGRIDLYSASLKATKTIKVNLGIFNPKNKYLYVSDGRMLYVLSPDLEKMIKEIQLLKYPSLLFPVKNDVADMCLNSDYTKLYYATEMGQIYKYDLNLDKIEFLFECDHPVEELSIDDNERYILLHHYYLRGLFEKNTTQTEIWSIDNKEMIEDLSKFNADNPKWIYGTSPQMIDVGHYLLSFRTVKSLMERIKSKCDNTNELP